MEEGVCTAWQQTRTAAAVCVYVKQTVALCAYVCVCRLISYIQPARNQELVDKLKAKKLTVIGALVVP